MADGEAAVAFRLREGDPLEAHPYPDWLVREAGNPAYGWAFVAWRSAAAVANGWYDAALADRIVAEWPEWARLTSNRFAGLPFVLSTWEEIIVRLLVAWKHPVEVVDPITHKPAIEWVRLFRRLILWIPRKNGKTEFLAALTLLFFTLDGLKGGEGYVFARDEEQGRIPFKKMKAMASLSPSLKDDLVGYGRSIYSKSLAASIQLLTGAEEGKQGKSPSVVTGDEIHEWRSRDLMDALAEGMGTQLQPIELYASTAGKKNNRVALEMWDMCGDIIAGHLFDPSTLAVIFAAPQEADYRDETVWALANPSLGISPTVQFLRQEAVKAAGNPRAEARFRCYFLDQWIEPAVRWLPLKKWDGCKATPDGWRDVALRMKGRKAWGAIDVSSTQDLTSLAWLFEPESDGEPWVLMVRFWVPEDSVERRAKVDKVNYPAWVADGAIETTLGDYVDQNAVMMALQDGLRDFDVQKIGFDPWNATKLVTDLQNEGVEAELFSEMRQGMRTLAEPSKHFERLVFTGMLDHGCHPVLRWQAGHVMVEFDNNDNFRPVKGRQSEKIDGIMASVMAVGLAMQNLEADIKPEIHFL